MTGNYNDNVNLKEFSFLFYIKRKNVYSLAHLYNDHPKNFARTARSHKFERLTNPGYAIIGFVLVFGTNLGYMSTHNRA